MKGVSAENQARFNRFLNALKAVKEAGHLTVLRLPFSLYSPEDIGLLAENAIKDNPSLIELDLSSSSLEPEHLSQLIPSLSCPNLQKIVLRKNKLEDEENEHGECIFDALADKIIQDCPNLEEIDLETNHVLDDIDVKGLSKLVLGSTKVCIRTINPDPPALNEDARRVNQERLRNLNRAARSQSAVNMPSAARLKSSVSDLKSEQTSNTENNSYSGGPK